MRVWNLTAIGPSTSSVVDPVFSYPIEDAEMAINTARALLRGSVCILLHSSHEGAFGGRVRFLQDGIHVMYDIRNDAIGILFTYAGFIHARSLGPVRPASGCPKTASGPAIKALGREMLIVVRLRSEAVESSCVLWFIGSCLQITRLVSAIMASVDCLPAQ